MAIHGSGVALGALAGRVIGRYMGRNRPAGAPTPMLELLRFINIVLDFVWWLIIFSAILSWLIGFNIVNRSNQLVWNIYDALNRITEPLYGPIRRLLPRTGAFDFAPLIVLFGIMFIQIVVLPNLAKLVV